MQTTQWKSYYEKGSIASITSSAAVEVLVVRIKMEKKKLTQFFKQTSSAQYYTEQDGEKETNAILQTNIFCTILRRAQKVSLIVSSVLRL